MLIDWFTIAAQVVNFLILVWLLKHFLYRPILRAIATREQRIANELAVARAATVTAQAQRDEFEQKSAAFEQWRVEGMAKAIDEAKAEQLRLIAQAREESNTLRVQWQEGLRNEYQNLQSEITARTQEEVFAIARKTLQDLAGASLEARMIEVFIQRVGEIKADPGMQSVTAVKTPSAPLVVRSVYALTVAQHDAVEAVVRTVFGPDCVIMFEIAADIVCGIELTVNGQRLAWSVADYLGALEQKVNQLLTKPAVLVARLDEPHGG